MTDKRYSLINDYGDYHIKKGDEELCYDLCNQTMAKENWNNVLKELNALHEEKEFWKSSACSTSNFNQILLNELDVAQEQGYEVSNPFKKLLEGKK